MEKLNPELLERAAQWIAEAENVVVFTGAGVSAESGIPTFRDAQTGLWARYDPMKLASVDGFLRDPRLVWEWYAYRRKLVREKEPNPGHTALVELESWAGRLAVVTQNVDSLHQRAGSSRCDRVAWQYHAGKVLQGRTCFSGLGRRSRAGR